MGTGGRSQQGKEVGFRYLLQMAVISLMEAGEVADEDGKRVMETLRDIATTASILLYQGERDVGGSVEAICGTLRVSHIDGDMIRAYLGRHRRVEASGC